LATKDKTPTVEDQDADIQRLKKRLDMLDERLDNIDSIVTAVAERVTSRPVILNIVCPNCGRSVEVAIIAHYKPTA
jgi:acetone carboxylase gamma subunit